MQPPDWAGTSGPDCPSNGLILTYPTEVGSYFEEELASDPFGLFTESPASLRDALFETEAIDLLNGSPFSFTRVSIPFGRSHEAATILQELYGRTASDAGGLMVEEDTQGSFDFVRGGDADTYATEMGLQLAHQAGITGADRRIAILDTGLDAPWNAPGIGMWDATRAPTQPGPPADTHGHGTAMHDLMAEVAPGATLIPIRVCKAEKDLSIWGTMIGLYLAAVDADADIISMSFGFSQMDRACPNCGGSAAMRSFALECVALQVARWRNSRGSRPLLVAATGNRRVCDIRANRRLDLIKSPANFQCVVAVGSVDSFFDLSVFSNYDSGALQPRHLMGFGGQMDQAGQPIEHLGQLSNGTDCVGTSPATAYVAGMLALLWSDPRYTHLGRETFLDAVEQGHCVTSGALSPAQAGSGVVVWDPQMVSLP